MEAHSRIFKIKIKSIIEVEHEYDFPEFLHSLRRAAGISRKKMSEQTNIHTSRINYLETGAFSEMPPEIVTLSSFFEVPKSLMYEKAKDFVSEKHLEKTRFKRERRVNIALLNRNRELEAL